jgi:predicted DNA-binding transcriptional regulator YafY
VPPAVKDDAISQTKVREVNEALMVAWCTDKKAWRSFRVANVTEVKQLA